MRLIVEAFTKQIQLWFLRRGMRRMAQELSWLQEQQAYCKYRIEQLEAARQRYQGKVWALEAPSSLVRGVPHFSAGRPAAGHSQRRSR